MARSEPLQQLPESWQSSYTISGSRAMYEPLHNATMNCPSS
jgi:hypothetical protein